MKKELYIGFILTFTSLLCNKAIASQNDDIMKQLEDLAAPYVESESTWEKELKERIEDFDKEFERVSKSQNQNPNSTTSLSSQSLP